MLKLIVALALVPSLLHAECLKPVTYLREGAQVPCTGYLFSPEKEFEVRTKVATYDDLTLTVEKQRQLLELHDSELQRQIQTNISLSSELKVREENNLYKTILFIGAGIVSGSLLTIGVIRATR